MHNKAQQNCSKIVQVSLIDLSMAGQGLAYDDPEMSSTCAKDFTD